jgi:hypothetical protein
MLVHIERAQKALNSVRLDGKNAAGVVMHRKIRNLPLKVAREEAWKALDLAEYVEWDTLE